MRCVVVVVGVADPGSVAAPVMAGAPAVMQTAGPMMREAEGVIEHADDPAYCAYEKAARDQRRAVHEHGGAVTRVWRVALEKNPWLS